MSGYSHLELVCRGPVSVLRIVDHAPLFREESDTLVAEWHSVAERPDCQTLEVDCSQAGVLGTDVVNTLLAIQRRLRQRQAKLVLRNLSAEARQVLRWTKLDRLLQIQEDAEPEAAIPSFSPSTPCGQAPGDSAYPEISG